MKRNLLWVLLFLGCIPVFVDAQPPGPCPGSTAPVAPFCSQTCTLCGQGIDGYVGMNANTPQWEAPPDFCAPQFHSVQWLAFVAGSTNITFQFSVSDCDDGNGLQVGIYGTTDCASWTSVSNCDPAVPENASTILNASGLVPGGTYLFVIDGNVGDVCQFQIDVLSGSTVAPPVTGTPSIIGPTNVCTGGTSTYTVAGVNGAGYYTWTLNGNPIGFDQTVDVTFPANGTYQLCVTPGNSCFGDGPTVCTNITVGPLPPELITDDICPEDLPYEYQDFTFSQSGTYNFEYTRPDGCIQPVVLNLTVNEPTPDSEFTVNICTGEAYIWQGLTYSQTGFYPRTFQDGNGCDYVITLELIVNPPDLEPLGEIYWCSLFGPYYVGNVPLTQSGDFSITLDNQFGCDSTVFGFLYITSPEFVFIDTIICPGEEVTIGDFSYTQTGNYQETYIEPGGCENFFQLQLLVYDPETFLDRTICSGESVTIGNSTYSTTGVYQKVLTSYLGCDSTVHLNLTVLPPITNSISAEICAGESYTFGSNTYTTAGTYSQVFPSANDCDSTVTLTLTVNPDVQTTLNRSVCFGESFTVGTSTFTQTGAYQVDLTSADGCDSTVFLNLTVKPEIITNLNPTICEGEVFSAGNMPFTDEGTYSITLTANDGCDSTVNINLTVLEHVETLLNASICLGQSYTVGTSTFNTTGNYTVVLNAANGCDSTVMLSLNVLGPIEETLDVAICTGQTYTVGNSTYSVPGFYTDILTNDIGCDSIVYLNLSIQDVLRDTLVLSLCEGESYPIGSNNYNSTGFYSGAFVTASGCDSVFYLDLTILPTRYTDLNITICEGESVMVGNSTYTSTGSYQNILTSVETNCDSIVSLQLTVNDVPETFLTRSICEGESFIVGSSTYTQTGSYLDVLAAANGCDSLVHLELTVLDVPETFLVENICDGTVFTVGNSTYATSGTYTNTLTAANGCDSIVHLDLTVLSIPETSLMVEICELESFSVGSSVYDQSGSYTDILSASSGCDSIVYLELVVYPIKERLLNISICDGGSYTVGGTNYTMAGTYVDTLVSANNCDSIVTLNLSVTDFYEINLLETICEGDAFSVGSNTYTSSGFYSNMFISSDGCDSIVNLDLTVLPIPRTTLDRVICDGESVSVGGTPYTNTGTYIDTLTAIETGCDSIVTLNLVVNEIYDVVLDEVICDGESFAVGSSSYNNTGTYVNVLTSSSGCDSTVTLNLTVNDIRQTSLSQTLCFGSSFSVGNSTYSNTGIFRDTLLSVETNCDSIVTLNLTILPQIITTISPTICFGDSFSVGNSTYSSSGAYADTLIAANGCDSVVALNLTVRDEIVSTLVEEICDGDQFTVGNSNYSNSGQYADTLLSVLTGCDSIVTLNLTVHPIPQTTLVEEICDGESFGVGNSDYTVSGQFVDTLTSLVTGCDSIVTLNLTVHPIPQTTLVAEICDGESFGVGTSSYTISGQFVDTLTSLVTGCDSIVTLQLTVKAILQTTLVEEICDGESFGVGN
ncbi:MAG TPA: hypothetical protein PKA00_03335, partial [Saprospiraceae bacterium]|nr:hypothetical protein [Saprospiraceae bacterium]HMQ81909.1 hypothetical protein [Saprospiraceae bacterium]